MTCARGTKTVIRRKRRSFEGKKTANDVAGGGRDRHTGGCVCVNRPGPPSVSHLPPIAPCANGHRGEAAHVSTRSTNTRTKSTVTTSGGDHPSPQSILINIRLKDMG